MALEAITKSSIEPVKQDELRAQRKEYVMSFLNKHLKKCYVGYEVNADFGPFRAEGIAEDLIDEIVSEYEAAGWTIEKRAQLLIFS